MVPGVPLSTVQLSGSRSRRYDPPLTTVWPPGSRSVLDCSATGKLSSRRCGHRGVALDGPATGEPLSMVQPPGSRSRRSGHRGVALDGPATGEPLSSRLFSHREAAQFSTVWPPGSRSRRSGHRGVALDGPATGKSLSTVRPPGSRSRRSGHRGVALDGPGTGESLSTVQPPGSRSVLDCLATGKPLSSRLFDGPPGKLSSGKPLWPPGSRSRRSSHRGAALDGPATGEPLSTVRPPGSRSRRSGHRGVYFM